MFTIGEGDLESMMNDWPKAVTTASIWISLGSALGFGLFKMNFSRDTAFLLLLRLTARLGRAAEAIAGGVAGQLLAV